MNLALIPARGGSKRIPRKNIRAFAGRPMIAWTIETVLETGSFDEVVVSTDDEEVAEVARAAGATTPFRRPAALADDCIATRPVIRHAIEWFAARGSRPDVVGCVYATAAFLRAADLRQAVDDLRASTADFVVSVTSYPYPIQRALRLREDARLEMIDPGAAATRSQDLEPAYHDAGQFYVGRADAFLSERRALSSSARAVVLPSYRVHDIDTDEDWVRAELVFDSLRQLGEFG